MSQTPGICCTVCKTTNETRLLAKIEEKPDWENDYGISDYYREIHQCNRCGVFLNCHDLIDEQIYSGEYNSRTLESLEGRFHRIIKLPFEQSDNKQRVARILGFFQKTGFSLSEISVLDVGSGTGVFPFEMTKAGLNCYAVDPDLNSFEHTQTVIPPVQCFHGSVGEVPDRLSFDCITFNKVLEHVRDPVGMLTQARCRLRGENSLIYIELPEGDGSLTDGTLTERKEFCIEHYTVFNLRSLSRLGELSGLVNVDGLRLVDDPSGKRTIYGFFRRGG